MTTNAKKVLEGLKGDNIEVTVRSLAKYMSSNGVLVKPYIGRARCYIPMPSSVYGVDPSKFSEEGGSFYRSRVSQSHLTFIPPEDDLALSALEKRLRRAVEYRALSDGFMPVSAYDSLKEEFQRIRKEYFEKRDEIIQNWEFLTAGFTLGIEEMLKGITILTNAQRESLTEVFLSQIPKAHEYRESFAMNLRVHAFPAESAAIPEGLNSSITADVQSTWSEEVVQTAILSIEKTIGEGWSKMLGAMRQYTNGASIRQNTISGLQKFAEDLKWKNVFKNPLLTHLHTELKGLSASDAATQAEAIESAVAYTYEYAKETGIDLDMEKSPYSMQELEAIGFVAVSQMKKGA